MKAWLREHLIDDIGRAWKFVSNWVFGLLVLLPVVWVELPDDLKSMIPAEWAPYVVSIVAAGGLIGRQVKQ
jgi:hypothetical protein